MTLYHFHRRPPRQLGPAIVISEILRLVGCIALVAAFVWAYGQLVKVHDVRAQQTINQIRQ